jgi:AcrR family transcriptional regulator
MSPQRSNRQALIEGALHCLEESPSPRITTRQIAAASKASIGSIRYHFGSTEALMGLAMAEGFRRWLHELAGEMGDVGEMNPVERIQRASEVVTAGVERHSGLVRAFLAAVARAPHDQALRDTLAESYRESRVEVALLLGLGEDQDAGNAASLLLATFDGLLVQAVLGPDNAITPADLRRGIARLAMATQL